MNRCVPWYSYRLLNLLSKSITPFYVCSNKGKALFSASRLHNVTDVLYIVNRHCVLTNISKLSAFVSEIIRVKYYSLPVHVDNRW